MRLGEQTRWCRHAFGMFLGLMSSGGEGEGGIASSLSRSQIRSELPSLPGLPEYPASSSPAILDKLRQLPSLLVWGVDACQKGGLQEEQADIAMIYSNT